MAADFGGGQCNEPVTLIQPEWFDVPKYWPVILPWVTKALEQGGVVWLPNDVYDLLLRKQAKLWLAWEGGSPIACAVTVLMNYQRLRSVSIFALGGSGLKKWLHFLTDIREYAKAIGAEAIEAPGRKAFGRILKRHGFKADCTIYRAKL